MANIQLLQGTEKIKDSYTKINTSVTNLNNAKMEKTADSDLNMNGHSIADIAAIDFGNWQTVTIDGSNAITVTKTHVRVDTSGGPGELHTINGGTRGQFIFLRCVSNSRPVTIKYNVGNIITNDSLDVLLNNANNIYLLLCTDGSNWTLIGNIGVKRSGDTMTGRLEFSGNQMGLRFRNGDSDTSAEFVDFPEASTANVNARLFRFTNTSGNKQFTLARGDGTANPAFTIINGAITRINEIVVTITAYVGNPNGNVAAPPGSICLDTANGVVYRKASGTGNTGWQAMA